MDAVERSTGGTGRWQLLVCLAVFASKFAIAWHQLSIVILAPPVDFWCSNGVQDKCSSECKREFNRTIFQETIITEWDLVCDRAQLANVAQLTFMCGILLGNVGFGFLADRFGRRGPLVWAIALQVCSGVAVAFVPWLWLFMVLRFICAFATGGTMLTGFVLVTEIVGAKWRTAAGVLFQIPFQIGHASLGLFGYYIRDWRVFQIVISAPSILLLSYYWIMPESPRWLLSVGRVDEAVKALRRGAEINKVSGPEIEEAEREVIKNAGQSKEKHKGGNALELIKTKNTRIKTICTCIIWLVIGLCYFGVAQYMGQIGGNLFVNVAIAGGIQIPANLVGIFIMDWKKLGRRGTMILFFGICAVAMLTVLVIPSNLTWIAGCVGMLSISVTFSVIYIFTGELFPTLVRNVAMGTASMFARFGSMTAPFVASIGTDEKWISPVVFGIMPIVAICSCFPLPETIGCVLQNTTEEKEEVECQERNDEAKVENGHVDSPHTLEGPV